jgi:hypothetical protein
MNVTDRQVRKAHIMSWEQKHIEVKNKHSIIYYGAVLGNF